jgi:4-diphosphocytidyl-2-C-methyl-D-erythritol kinase
MITYDTGCRFHFMIYWKLTAAVWLLLSENNIPMSLEIKAPAKINLTLEVLGKREDGFHNITSVMQTIDLCDSLIISEGSEITLDIDTASLPEWDGLRNPGVSFNIENNLVFRAAELLRQKTGYRGGTKIDLKKIIPSAAGLGGGSSDAAATLKGLNSLWSLGLKAGELSAIGAELGSDIPFFIYGGTGLAEGRGEKITLLISLLEMWVVLLVPFMGIPQKTKTLYSHIGREQYTNGDITGIMVRSIDSNADNIACWNVFTGMYPALFPESGQYFQQFQNAGVSFFQVCGSGPALFTLTPHYDDAVKIAGKLRASSSQSNPPAVFVTKFTG